MFPSFLIIYKETAKVQCSQHTHICFHCHVYLCLLSVFFHQSFTVTNLCEKNLQVCIFLPQQIVSAGLSYLLCISFIYSCKQLVSIWVSQEARAGWGERTEGPGTRYFYSSTIIKYTFKPLYLTLLSRLSCPFHHWQLYVKTVCWNTSFELNCVRPTSE